MRLPILRFLTCIMVVALLFAVSIPSFATAAVEVAETTVPSVFTCDNVSEIPKAECEALVVLYNSTNGPGWVYNDGWLQTNEPCHWSGVDCRDNHVIDLFLGPNQLSGHIPPELGNLTRLQALFLHLNQLTGPIPPELGDLVNLETLYLMNNQLTGSIPPTLGNLAHLQHLQMSNNQLNGAIPAAIGNLAELRVLDLAGNRLSGGIPPELSELASVYDLDLSANELSGQVPPSLGDLAKLRWLSFGNNRLSGALPAALMTLELWSFQYGRTDLCEPGDAVFQGWLSAISWLEGTGVTCGTQAISGSVWNDISRDGVLDSGEPFMADVAVTLASTIAAPTAMGRQVLTDSNGQYHFVNVASGPYTVAAVMPGGYLPTQPWFTGIIVPEEGDVTVPPIGLAWAPVHLYLPLTRSR